MSRREIAKPITNGDKSVHPRRDELGRYSVGLTKREHFAGLAMKGLLDNGLNIESLTGAGEFETVEFCNPEATTALLAMGYADALLAVLEDPATNNHQPLIDIALLMAQELQEFVNDAAVACNDPNVLMHSQELLQDWNDAYGTSGLTEQDHFKRERTAG